MGKIRLIYPRFSEVAIANTAIMCDCISRYVQFCQFLQVNLQISFQVDAGFVVVNSGDEGFCRRSTFVRELLGVGGHRQVVETGNLEMV